MLAPSTGKTPDLTGNRGILGSGRYESPLAIDSCETSVTKHQRKRRTGAPHRREGDVLVREEVDRILHVRDDHREQANSPSAMS